jgi:hypothetical protein
MHDTTLILTCLGLRLGVHIEDFGIELGSMSNQPNIDIGFNTKAIVWM